MHARAGVGLSGRGALPLGAAHGAPGGGVLCRKDSSAVGKSVLSSFFQLKNPFCSQSTENHIFVEARATPKRVSVFISQFALTHSRCGHKNRIYQRKTTHRRWWLKSALCRRKTKTRLFCNSGNNKTLILFLTLLN